MTNEEYIKMMKDNTTLGTWYNVCYISSPYNYGKTIRNYSDMYICKVEKMRVLNINGMGTGFIYFSNKDNKIVYLPWIAIVSMIPSKDSEKENQDGN